MSAAKLREEFTTAANSGKFGDNYIFVDLDVSGVEGDDHFASDTIFAKVKLQNGSSEKTVSVVVKRQPSDAVLRDMMHLDEQFYNEHIMYSEVLPFLERCEVVKTTFPALFFSNSTLGETPENDIVVIEDLRPYGFRLSKERIFLDYEHCVLALKALGRFHALSYAMKRENPDRFFELVSKLKTVKFGNDDEESRSFLKISMERGILPLIEGGEHAEKLRNFLKKHEDPTQFLDDLRQPEEPVSVLCHGDFNRNNIVFKYDDAGKPTEVKFFDVATSRYTTPAVDLAFFLCMNTTSDLRKTHWEDFLNVYHQGLSSAIPNCQVPSLEAIRQELAQKAIHGYALCSFFIPMMLTPEVVVDLSTMSPEDMKEMARTRGGEHATNIVSNIVRDLAEFNCM